MGSCLPVMTKNLPVMQGRFLSDFPFSIMKETIFERIGGICVRIGICDPSVTYVQWLIGLVRQISCAENRLYAWCA